MSNSRDDDNDNDKDKSRRRSYKDFIHAGDLKTPAITRSHPANFVTKVVREDELRKLKHQHFWVIKEAQDLRAAEQEKHAQEYLRILMPHQPKTRVVRDENNKAYVLSKVIPGFVSLDEMIFENMPPGLDATQESYVAGIRARLVNRWFKDHKDLNDSNDIKDLYDPQTFNDLNIKNLNQLDLSMRASGLGDRDGNDAAGVGELMITSIKIYEIDFKEANIGKNKDKKFAKIDGGETYSYPIGKKDCPPIIADTIERLPWAPDDYPAYNWFDMRMEGQNNPRAILVGGGSMKEFRSGVNRGILKMLLFPDDLAVKHTRANISVAIEADEMIAYDHEKKQELEVAALNTASFREYLSSPEAQKIKAEFLQNLINHKIESKIKLVDDPVKTQGIIEEKFKDLQSAAQVKTFLSDFRFILDNYGDTYTSKSLLNQSFVDKYYTRINDLELPAKERMQNIIGTAKEAVENAPKVKLSITSSLFGKTPSAKEDMLQFHKIILLFETKPALAMTKIRDLRNEFFKSEQTVSKATNSTRPPSPRGGNS